MSKEIEKLQNDLERVQGELAKKRLLLGERDKEILELKKSLETRTEEVRQMQGLRRKYNRRKIKKAVAVFKRAHA